MNKYLLRVWIFLFYEEKSIDSTEKPEGSQQVDNF